MKKKIVIIGGLGYIGTELCKIYSGESWSNSIVVIDSRFVSERVAQLRDWKIDFKQGGLLDKDFLKRNLFDADIVFHLAGITDVAYVKKDSNKEQDDKIKTIAIEGTRNVLKSINKLRSKNERLITLIGCGGNRDESKRPIMGKIASHESDKVILTSDNPRFENPEKIIDSMYKGIPEKFQNKVIKEVNRKDAIKIGVDLMKTNDILLIAGKGHEKFQDVNGKQIHFDEKLILKKIIQDVRK